MKPNTHLSKISYQAAGWQGDGAHPGHRRGREGTCPSRTRSDRTNVDLGT